MPCGRRGGTKLHVGRREGVARTATARDDRNLRLSNPAVKHSCHRQTPSNTVTTPFSGATAACCTASTRLSPQNERPMRLRHQHAEHRQRCRILMTLGRQHVLAQNDGRVWHQALKTPDNRPLRGGRLYGVHAADRTSDGVTTMSSVPVDSRRNLCRRSAPSRV